MTFVRQLAKNLLPSVLLLLLTYALFNTSTLELLGLPRDLEFTRASISLIVSSLLTLSLLLLSDFLEALEWRLLLLSLVFFTSLLVFLLWVELPTRLMSYSAGFFAVSLVTPCLKIYLKGKSLLAVSLLLMLSVSLGWHSYLLSRLTVS